MKAHLAGALLAVLLFAVVMSEARVVLQPTLVECATGCNAANPCEAWRPVSHSTAETRFSVSSMGALKKQFSNWVSQPASAIASSVRGRTRQKRCRRDGRLHIQRIKLG
jgi:hypothetical protein